MSSHNEEAAQKDEPTIAFGGQDRLELRWPDGRVESTGLVASLYLPGSPPIVDEVEFEYFEQAWLHEVDGELWIEVRGGSDGDGARQAGETGWYRRGEAECFELHAAPQGEARTLGHVRVRSNPRSA